MSGRTVLGIDIGGTKTAVAVGPSDGRAPERAVRFATPPDATAALHRLLEEAGRLVADRPVDAVGVSFGGHVDGEHVHSLHVPGWDDAGLVPTLRDAFGVGVRVVNDAEAGAIAEHAARATAGRAVRNLLYVTVSTGIGGAVVADDRLVRGAHGLAGELGHYVMADEGRCSCGGVGHLEALASGTAIARRAARELAGTPADARAVALAAAAGDEAAARILVDAATLLGRALALAALTVDPDVVVLGGGVAQAGETYWAPLRRALSAGTLRPVPLEATVHGTDSPLVGALVVAGGAGAWLPAVEGAP